jgi:DNA-binding NarL/FixJ family response regulator
VYTALALPEAIALLDSTAIDVVVADFKLPGSLGGHDLLAWLRRHRPALVDRVVFTFADGQSENVREFLAAAGCAALHKPFRVDEFLSIVQQTYSRRDETALTE